MRFLPRSSDPTSRRTRIGRGLVRGTAAGVIAITVALTATGTASAEPTDGAGDTLSSSAGPPESPYTGTDLEIAGTFAGNVIQMIDRDWSAWFVDRGLAEPRVGYELVEPDQVFQSSCGMNGASVTVDTDTPNAFFCGADRVVDGYQGTIVVPVRALRRIWDGNLYDRQVKQPGDIAVATVLAHEFGHHVADELVAQHQFSRMPATNEDNELLADCLAGNWVASAYGEGRLGDDREAVVDQAVGALETLGDYEFASPQHHGTPAERADAVRIGIYGTQDEPTPALPQNCFNAYWH